MFRMRGEKERCVWCGKEAPTEMSTITISSEIEEQTSDTFQVCSLPCERALRDARKRTERNVPLLFVGGLFGAILFVMGFVSDAKLVYISAIGLTVMGIVWLAFSFSYAPITRWFGFYRGSLLVRAIGLVIAILGGFWLWMALLALR